MKEAFWGVLIVMLGLFGIVVVNLFQRVTIDNDKVYYVIKEATEASMYDAVDLATYRLTGRLRMVEDKFVENLARRFAQNVSLGNYTITVQDINETPPYVSVVVKSNITSIANIKSIKNEQFVISNGVNAILETKYTLKELLEFLEMTEEEWDNIQKDDTNNNICDMLINQDDYECIPKDLKFGGWEDVNVESSTCSDSSPTKNIPATATYYACECGKWSDPITKTIYSTSAKTESSIDYTWSFNSDEIYEKDEKLRNINEIMTRKTKLDVCTTGVDIMVPRYLTDINMPLPTDLTEPSKNDNSQYVACPPEGIKIPSEQKIVLHGGYIPTNATNRTLEWSKDNGTGIKSIDYDKNSRVSKNSYSKAIVTAATVEEKNKTKESVVTATTTLGQSSTCKITVWDGSVDTVRCGDIGSLEKGKSQKINVTFTPNNATKTDFTYASDNTAIATIDSNGNVNAKGSGTANIIITDKYNGKTGKCKVTVPNPEPTTTTTVSAEGTCSCTGMVKDIAKSCFGPDPSCICDEWKYSCDKYNPTECLEREPARCLNWSTQYCEKYLFGKICIKWSTRYCTRWSTRSCIKWSQPTCKSGKMVCNRIGSCIHDCSTTKKVIESGNKIRITESTTSYSGLSSCRITTYCKTESFECNRESHFQLSSC